MTRDDLQFAQDLAIELYGGPVRAEAFTRSNNPLVRIETPVGLRILKLAAPGVTDRIAKELAVIERVAREGIPVPDVEHADTDGRERGRAFLLMRSAGERTVMEWAGRIDPVGSALFKEMGSIHARIHQVTFDRSGDVRAEGVVETDQSALVVALASWAEELVAQGLLKPSEAALFRNAPIPETQGRSLCHGDFHAVQCVVEDDRIRAIVDWEAAWSGNPIIDLAFTHAYLDFYASKELRKSYLEGYTDLRELPVGYVEAYLPVRMAQVLGVMRAWHAQGDRAWRSALQGGRVERLVALFRTYCSMYGR